MCWLQRTIHCTSLPFGCVDFVKLCIMLSHASKRHNLILMISYICRVILNYTMTSLTLCCLVRTLSISLCYSSVVNKHQLLALSVLCLFVELTMVAE